MRGVTSASRPHKTQPDIAKVMPKSLKQLSLKLR